MKTYTVYFLAEKVTAKGLVIDNYSAELTVRINTSIFSKLEVKNVTWGLKDSRETGAT